MRDRLLVRHFLWRFLEHDLASPNTDRHGALSAAAGLLIAMSLFAAVLVAWPYQLFPDLPAGLASLSSLDDRFLFVSMSMLVMALAAVAQWDALMLDARDAAMLGPLPIPHRLIVRSKFAATGLFALAVLATWNLIPTVLRGAAVPGGLRIGWLGTLQLTLAHGVVSCAAGLFGFLTMLGLREGVYAIVGPSRFTRVSTTLQAGLIVVLTTALLLLPGQSTQVARRWFANESRTAQWLPPVWFVGLHETLAGSVIDGVPRTRAPFYAAEDEEAATALYRSLRPAFPRFRVIALSGLFSVAMLAAAACLWNSRRLPGVVSRAHSRRGIAGRLWKWTLTSLVARTALRQAGFSLSVQALSRCASQRITMAGSVAVALALAMVVAFRPAPTITPVSVPLLATQSIVMAIVLIGFRHATRVPAELRGATTFSLAWPGAPAPFVAGVKRAGLIFVVLPILALMFIWHAETIGLLLALLHLGVGIAVAFLTLDALFFHNRRVPLASAYTPSQDPKVTGLVYCATVLAGAFGVAFVERASFEAPWVYAGLLATLLGASACLKRFDRVSPAASIELDVDEQALLPTQRLSLSG